MKTMRFKSTRMMTFLAATVILGACATAAPGYSADKPYLLIMGEDADEDTVPRNSRVFKRVLDALSNQLHDEGFDVFDETAVSLDNFAQGRVRRTDAELIDIARTLKRPPMDVIALFSIYAAAEKKSYTTKIRIRIPGRLLNVRTGQRLGNFEVVSPKQWNAPVKCPRECILEVVGDNAKILANDVGAVLAEKLANLTRGGDEKAGGGEKAGGLPSAVTLIFDGFSPEEYHRMEEYLVVFKGYKKHRPVYMGKRRQEIWYESQSESARLERNLDKMLEHLGWSGRITFSGNVFTLQKITTRKKS